MIVTIILIWVSFLFSDSNAATYNASIGDSTFNDTIRDKCFYTAVLASLTTTINMLIEVILNLNSNVAPGSYGSIMFLVPALLLYDIVTLMVVIPTRNIHLFWCMLNTRDYVSLTSFTIYLVRYGNTVWAHAGRAHGIFVLGAMVIVFRQYSLEMLGVTSAISSVAVAALISLFFVLIYNVYYHYQYLRCEAVLLQVYDYCCAMYGGNLLFSVTGAVLLFAAFGNQKVTELTVPYLTTYTYIFQVLIISVYVTHTRLQIIETAKKDLSALKEKFDFVRYVSHQVRVTNLDYIITCLLFIHLSPSL
jgi:hypothetical protein